MVDRPDDGRVGELVGPQDPLGRLPAAAGPGRAGRLARQRPAVVVDDPAVLGGEPVAIAQLEVQGLVVQLVKDAPGVGVGESRDGLDAPGVDVDAARHPASGQVDDPFEEGRPHVQLDLLGHPHALVEHPGKPVAAPGPRLDGEDEVAIGAGTGTGAGGRGELDLARLQVPDQGGQPERGRGDGHDAHRPVPRPGHAHDELVVDREHLLFAEHLHEPGELGRRGRVDVGTEAGDELLGGQLRALHPHSVTTVEQRPDAVLGSLHLVAVDPVGEGRRGVLSRRPRLLAAVEGGDPPHVVPRREPHTQGPDGSGGETSRERRPAGHGSSPTRWVARPP